MTGETKDIRRLDAAEFLEQFRTFIIQHYGAEHETYVHGCETCEMWKVYNDVKAVIGWTS
jgi:hypothetical protein